MKTLLSTILIVLVFFASVPISHAKANDGSDPQKKIPPALFVRQLTNDTYDDREPQINNADEVVYEKHIGDESRIYMWADCAEADISYNSGLIYNYNPQINSKGDVLWESRSENGNEHKIVLKPYWWVPTCLFPPDKNNYPQYLPQYFFEPTLPQFNDDNQIVWSAVTNIGPLGKKDLFYYSDNDYEHLWGCYHRDLSYKNPQINAHGVVVWQGGEWDDCGPSLVGFPQNHYDIYVYDGSSVKPISKNMTGDDENPQINDNGIVVWENQGRIYRYDISLYPDEEPEPISISAEYAEYENTAPQINRDNSVVWQGCNGSDCEIFLYDGVKTVNISNDPNHDDEGPQINEMGRVIWVKDYASCNVGPWCYIDPRGKEIMLYRGAYYYNTVTNISNRVGDDEDPQINYWGDVVWSGYDQDNWEIFRAENNGGYVSIECDTEVTEVEAAPITERKEFSNIIKTTSYTTFRGATKSLNF